MYVQEFGFEKSLRIWNLKTCITVYQPYLIKTCILERFLKIIIANTMYMVKNLPIYDWK